MTRIVSPIDTQDHGLEQLNSHMAAVNVTFVREGVGPELAQALHRVADLAALLALDPRLTTRREPSCPTCRRRWRRSTT